MIISISPKKAVNAAFYRLPVLQTEIMRELAEQLDVTTKT